MKKLMGARWAHAHDFSKKLMNAIDRIATLREIRIENRSQEWLDRDIRTAIETRN